MKRVVKYILAFTLAAPLFFACAKDELKASISELNSSGKIMETAIAPTDLIGRWNLVSMTSNIPVDLDFNQTSSTDILSETDCFDSMYFTFDAAGNITTRQAKLDFGADGNKFECGFGEYSAKYEINGNELRVFFTLDSIEMEQVKIIGLSTDGTDTYLHITLEEFEAAQYVDDPGNTVASNVERIETIYKKQ